MNKKNTIQNKYTRNVLFKWILECGTEFICIKVVRSISYICECEAGNQTAARTSRITVGHLEVYGNANVIISAFIAWSLLPQDLPRYISRTCPCFCYLLRRNFPHIWFDEIWIYHIHFSTASCCYFVLFSCQYSTIHRYIKSSCFKNTKFHLMQVL